MQTVKERRNFAAEIIGARVRDKETLLRAGKNIDALRSKFGKCAGDFDSTKILRRIRESKIR